LEAPFEREVAMHARHVTVKGSSERIDDGARAVQERVFPILKESKGFRGQLLLLDRDKGEVVGISLWDTEEDMLATEDKVKDTRQQVSDTMGASAPPEMRMFELAFYETA
jgi:heme-degrading monooxygenase HmoA